MTKSTDSTEFTQKSKKKNNKLLREKIILFQRYHIILFNGLVFSKEITRHKEI
jgi:hypothetical protein